MEWARAQLGTQLGRVRVRRFVWTNEVPQINDREASAIATAHPWAIGIKSQKNVTSSNGPSFV